MFTEKEQIGYKLHYPLLKNKIEMAKNILNEFITKVENPYIAVSFGKDSIVALHLILSIKSDIKVVWIERGEGGDIPDIFDVIQFYKDKYKINLIYLKTPKSLFELYKEYGIEFIDTHKFITKQLKQTFNNYTENNNIDGIIWGLRSRESKGRCMFAKAKGNLYLNKSNRYICSPVLYFTARDIWSYIYMNNLKYISFYEKLSEKDFDRENIRYSNWAGTIDMSRGRWFTIRRYYPELYQKFVKKFPEIKSYS